MAQAPSLVGRVSENLEMIENLSRQAAEGGADMILWPEAFATGYSYRSLAGLLRATAQPLHGEISESVLELAEETGMVICCGMLERAGEMFFNTQLVAYPDRRLEYQRKGSADEPEASAIQLEPQRRTFVWKERRFGILICADNNMDDWATQYSGTELDLLLHPCAGRIPATGRAFEQSTREEATIAFEAGRKLAMEMEMSYAAANLIGFSGEDYYPGNSFFFQADGTGWQMAVEAREECMTPSIQIFTVPSRNAAMLSAS